MKDISLDNVRNFALLGHTGSGKTALADTILFHLGISDKPGPAAAGASLSDCAEEEIARRISVYSKPFAGNYKTKAGKTVRVAFIDTPGYDDFCGQMLAATRAADSALIAVDAVAGMQIGTKKAWKRASELGMPRGIAITGIDRENADFNGALARIRETWGNKCVAVSMPSAGGGVVNLPAAAEAPDKLGGEAREALNTLMESAAEAEDALLEKYLGGEPLSAQELERGLRKAILSGGAVPVFAVSSAKNAGVSELLECVARLFPGPAELERKDAAGQPVAAAKDAPAVAWVWRTVTDPYAGKLAYARILGGTLAAEAELINCTTGQKERINGLLLINGKKQAQIEEASAGEIVALPKLKNTAVGNVLCAAGTKVELPALVWPEPVVSVSVVAKDRADEDKISNAIAKASEDDPTLRVERNKETRETVISGMGDTHIEVAIELMKKRGNVAVETGVPKIAYKETVTSVGDGHYKHKKQSGGRGQYAEVYCKVKPLPEGEEWFEDAIVGGVIPRNFIPACEKGFVESLAKGVLAGYPVVNVRVTVYDGSFHEVDSSEIAFKIAAGRAFKDAMSKAKPVLLEPIMSLRVTVPEQHMGDINGDLNHRRGRILGMDVEDGAQVIVAEAPRAELFRYCSELRSMTGGKGAFEMKFNRFEIVPSNIAQKIIAAATAEPEDEE